MKPTDISNPDYFHKVVDCQWACPAHTPVPEYIRLIAAGRYTDAYMVNWESNVFPGMLGRTCDRPCEPACRRGRVEKEPVAICRLKRVAADNKDDIRERLPKPPAQKNGKRIALIGGGPASLTVARDLLPLGYEVRALRSGPAGRRHDAHADSEVPPAGNRDRRGSAATSSISASSCGGQRIDSMKALLAEGYDAIFVGCGAPRGRDLDIPGRKEAAANIHIGIDWLSSVSFGHIDSIGKRVIVLGGGNTAMDCCRTSRRLGGEDVNVVVRSGFEEMKASPWEKEDAMHEGIPIFNFLVPKEFTHENGKLTGVVFEKVKAEHDAKGRRNLVPTGEPDGTMECDDVLVAVGQENAFPWIERDLRHRIRQMGHAEGRSEHHAVDQSESLLRRRRGVRPEEHHLGGGARPRGRDLDRSASASGEDVNVRPAPDMAISPARRWASTSGATTTRSRSTSAIGCRTARKW